MRDLKDYDVVVFDLDGLLVDTEQLHYRAYEVMCSRRGYPLELTFAQYFFIAQSDPHAIRNYIYARYPRLLQEEPTWEVLYQEKKAAYIDIINTEAVPLMPGAKLLLQYLQKENKRMCVVTHSQRDLVVILRKGNPTLDIIPHWITREDYDKPKPSADGYEKALQLFTQPNDHVIGFEDSRRGMRALLQTRICPVLINGFDASLREEFQAEQIDVFTSLQDVVSLQCV